MLVKVMGYLAGHRREVEVETGDVLKMCSPEDMLHELTGRMVAEPDQSTGALERWNDWVAAG